jgi:hypothetical protein
MTTMTPGSASHVLHPGKTSDRLRRRLWFLIFALIALLIVLVIIWIGRQPRPNRNNLAVGKNASQPTLWIKLQPPVELNYKSKAEVLALRTKAVSRYPGLLAGEYLPADSVFGQIENGLPWWGMQGQFYFGSGSRSIEGPAEETRFLLNPYLLVGADFYGLSYSGDPKLTWDTKRITEAQLNSPDFPLDCPAALLQWFPREARAEATYNVGDCIQRMSQWATRPVTATDMYFDLIAYNARDMNLNYVYLSPANSLNLAPYVTMSSPFAISHFLHRGGSCGYPGGCNNMSPPTPELDSIRITALPARAYMRLWANAPRSVEQPPDMTFIITFR